MLNDSQGCYGSANSFCSTNLNSSKAQPYLYNHKSLTDHIYQTYSVYYKNVIFVNPKQYKRILLRRIYRNRIHSSQGLPPIKYIDILPSNSIENTNGIASDNKFYSNSNSVTFSNHFYSDNNSFDVCCNNSNLISSASSSLSDPNFNSFGKYDTLYIKSPTNSDLNDVCDDKPGKILYTQNHYGENFSVQMRSYDKDDLYSQKGQYMNILHTQRQDSINSQVVINEDCSNNIYFNESQQPNNLLGNVIPNLKHEMNKYDSYSKDVYNYYFPQKDFSMLNYCNDSLFNPVKRESPYSSSEISGPPSYEPPLRRKMHL